MLPLATSPSARSSNVRTAPVGTGWVQWTFADPSWTWFEQHGFYRVNRVRTLCSDSPSKNQSSQLHLTPLCTCYYYESKNIWIYIYMFDKEQSYHEHTENTTCACKHTEPVSLTSNMHQCCHIFPQTTTLALPIQPLSWRHSAKQQIFWHSVWHIFWHSFWHIFWHAFWHIFWHSFWHIEDKT